jgi:GH25 family lysozyme M1 (1,4-beta-N-acetylmuramidase)
MIFCMRAAPDYLFRFLSTTAVLGLALAFGPAQALAQRPLGIDVSHYDLTIIWANVKSAGISFAWAKATEGSGTGDAYFASNISNAKAAGVCIGAYHFAHPEANSPGTEANYFWSVAGSSIKNDGLSVQPMLDYETFTAPGNIPVGATNYSDWANQWCNAIVSKAAAAGVTVKPVIYTATGSGGACNLNSSVAQWNSWLAQPDGGDPQTGNPWEDGGCEEWGSGVWTVWQYSWTGSVPGVTGAVDLDVFNGTSNQMATALVIGNNTSLPFVTLAPQLDRVVDSGGSVSFTGNASGTPPLNYQWLLNGTTIPGANTNTYNLTNAQMTNAGNYSLVVTNAYGNVTSSIVRLIVYPVQAMIFSDSFDTNSAANWTVNKSSSDNAVIFNFDYSTLGIPSAPHSTGGTTLGVQMKANLTLGVVAALSISPTNQSFSGDYRLHFDGWINVNGPLPGGGQGSTEFLTAGIGTAGNRTEWTGSGSTADGFYFSADGDGGVSAASTTTGDYSGYAGTVWKNAGSGIYAAGSLDNANPYYTAMFPTGQSAPALQQANYAQQTGALNPGTFGLAWHDVIVSRRGSTVDWAVDGIRTATISNATFSASNIFVGFWDPFASLSSNSIINFGLVDNVRVEVPAVAPVITEQPQGVWAGFGSNVTFSVTASGLPAPSLQWLFNGTNLFGMTDTNLVLTNIQAANAGNYSVVATNVAGSVISSNALLSIIPTQPAQFQLISLQPDASVQLVATGQAGATYVLETSTNLVNWTAFTNRVATDGLLEWNFVPPANDLQRFFRARSGP